MSAASRPPVVLSSRLAALGQIALLWLVLASANLPFQGFLGNEVDVLPYAKQRADPQWLAGDWFLNREISYRGPFNAIAGPMVQALGFEGAAIVVRLGLDLLLAVAMHGLLSALGLGLAWRIVVVALYLRWPSLVAREWIVGGAETKPVAYACVFLAAAAFVRRRYGAAWAWSGLALTFHVLVGGYALICAAVAWLLQPRRLHREVRSLARWIWLVPVLGGFGAAAVLEQLTGGSGMGAGGTETREAYAIYVQHRVPHHLLPSSWESGWQVPFGLVTLFFAALTFSARGWAARWLAGYGLAASGLFGVGLVVARVADVAWLRYYWFRLPDVLLPWLSFALLAWLVEAWARRRRGPRRVLHGLATAGAVWAGLTATLGLAGPSQTAPPLEVFTWISENTPRDAVFLADPMFGSFYVHAERAVVATFKHAPHAAEDIEAWYARLLDLGGGRPPSSTGSWRGGELRAGFYRLAPRQLKVLAERYGATHILWPAGRGGLPWVKVYGDGVFAVYRVGESPES